MSPQATTQLELAARADALVWETERMRAALSQKLRELARIHDILATKFLEAGNADGWIDLAAAITASAQAGDWHEAVRLLKEWETVASRSAEVETGVRDEHLRLRAWVESMKLIAAGDPTPEGIAVVEHEAPAAPSLRVVTSTIASPTAPLDEGAQSSRARPPVWVRRASVDAVSPPPSNGIEQSWRR